MKPILVITLFGLSLYACLKLGDYLARPRDPRESQFDDGNEDDNHLHV